MAENKKTDTNIQVIYVDPNTDISFYGEKTNEMGLMLPPEDLSIYVRLLVHPISNKSFNDGRNKVIEVTTTMINEQSIPSGTEYNKATVRVLTTDYLDYGWQEAINKNSPHGQPESLGISTIDVQYTSWYVPEITIKFIDIMGMSLMNPMQAGRDLIGGETHPVYSLFKSFYMMPYPLYTLTIKGFYGDPVTYDLQCYHVETTINTNTGNTEITAKFLGYTFAKWNSINIAWLMTVPYMKSPEDMIELWSNENRTYSTGGVVERYLDVRKNINTIIDSGKISEIEPESRVLSEFFGFSDILSDISNNIETVILTSDPFIEDKRNRSTDADNSLANFRHFLTPESQKELEKLNESLNKFNKKLNSITKKNRGDFSLFIIKKYNQNIGLPELFPNQNKKNQPIQKYEFNFNMSFEEELIYISDVLKYLEDTRETYNNNIKALQGKKETINSDIMNAQQSETQYILEKLKFKPTLKNMLEWIFSHYVLFEDAFFSVKNNVNGINIRKDISTESKINTKINRIEPWFTVRTQYENKGWYSLYPASEKARHIIDPDDAERLPEVQFSRGFHKAHFEILEGLGEEYSEVDVNYTPPVKKWFPLFAYDISNKILPTARHDDNPYKSVITRNNISADIMNISIQIILRMFASLGTYNIYHDYIDNDYIDIISKNASADVDNLLDAIKNEESICERIKYALDSNDFKNYILTLINKDKKMWESSYKIEHMGLPDNNIEIGTHTPLLKISTRDNRGTSYTLFTKNNAATLPLYSMTWSDMNRGDNVIDKDPIPQLFSGYSMSNIYEGKTMNMIKSSYNIIDADQYVIDNLVRLYKDFSVSEHKHLVDNWSYIEDGFEPVKNLLYNNKHIINGIDDKTNKEKYPDIYFSSPKKILPQHIGVLNTIRDKNTNFFDAKILFNNYDDLTRLDLHDYIKSIRETSSISTCVALPNTGRYSTIFANPFYYNCNKINNEKHRMCYKSYLLLNSMGIILDNIMSEKFLSTLYNSKITRLQKYICLTIGSIIYIQDGDILGKIYADEPEKWEGVDNKLLDIPIKTVSYRWELKKIVKVLRYDIKKTFSNFFEVWASGDGNKIIKDLEYGNYKNYKDFSTNLGYHNSTKEEKNTISKEIFSGLNAYYMGAQFSSRSADLFISESNEPYRSFVQLFLNPENESVKKLMSLYKDDVIIFNSRIEIYSETERNDTCSIMMRNSNIITYVDTFVSTLREKMLGLSEENHKDDEDNIISEQDNDLVKKIYYDFKGLHDRWYAGLDKKNERESTVEKIMSNILIIDKFYCDVSDKLFIDFKKVGDLLDRAFNNSQSLLDFIYELAREHGCFVLAQPAIEMFKSGDYFGEDKFMEHMFKPKPITECNLFLSNPGLVIMKIEEPSKTPSRTDDEDDFYEDETLQLGKNNSFELSHRRGFVGEDNKHSPIRAFGVTFGKGNQSYFKIGNLSNRNPQITEQVLMATQDILQKNKADGTSGQYIGQDLFNIYSSYSYTCTIKMLGCAPISPLMYFQLNNVYLFTGAYMIFKMSHVLSPGKMETTFTGIKQSVYKQEMVEKPVITITSSTPIVSLNYKQLHSIDFNIGNRVISDETIKSIKTERIDNKKKPYGPEALISGHEVLGRREYERLRGYNVSEIYTLRDCIGGTIKNNSIGNKIDGSYEKAGGEMPIECFKNLCGFMPYVDQIYYWVKSEDKFVGKGIVKDCEEEIKRLGLGLNPKDFKLQLTSVWRHRDNGSGNKTYHGYGTAVDIQIYYGDNKITDVEFYIKTLYSFILSNDDKFNYTELYLERKDNGAFHCLHYASTPNRGKLACQNMGKNAEGKWRTCRGLGRTTRCEQCM